MAVHRDTLIRTCALAAAAFMATCASGSGVPPSENTAQATAKVGSVSATQLHLTQETLDCSSTFVQNVLKIENNGGTPVPLSDISIKLWVDETTASSVVASLSNAGCISAHGTASNDCATQGKVRGVAATAVQMSTPCGPSDTSQANWEVTITNTDDGVIPPGQSWHKLHSKLALPSNAAFDPGPASWYSSCQAIDGATHETSRIAVYVGGDLVTSSPGVPPSCVAPQGSQPVPGAAAPAVAQGQYPLVGPVPLDTTITLAISLPLQNAVDLDAFIARTQDPTDPLFHQYLDPAGFRDQYGPSQSDYDAVIAWATANGLTVTHTYTSRALLNVTGTAAAVEKALLVTINLYQRADGTIFYAPANDPSINLSVPILSIAGLDSLAIPQPLGGTGPAFGSCPLGTGTGGNAYTGTDFRKAYFPGLPVANDGAGQTVALIEFDGFYPCDNPGACSPGFVSDTQSYANQKLGITLQPQQIVVNLPPATTVGAASNGVALPAATINVGSTAGYPMSGVITIAAGSGNTQVSYSGVTATSFTGCTGGTGTMSAGNSVSSPLIPSTAEPALDVELVASVAPGATIKVYEWEHNGTPNVSSDAFPTILAQVANDNDAPVVNNSWVWQGTGSVPEAGIKNVFRQLAAQGQTFIQAAGDTGSYASAASCAGTVGHCKVSLGVCNANADCPGFGDSCLSGVPSPIIDSPYMLVVGGTQLTTDASQSYTSETVWNNSTNGTIVPLFGASGGGKATCYTNGAGTLIPTLPLPLWQVPVNGVIGSTARMIPDVTMVATQIGGVFGGQPASADGPQVNGMFNACQSGTSASAALWAGVAALINQQAPKTYGALGFANPRLYTIAQSAGNVRDVTTGDNTFSGSGVVGASAGAGFDLASGLGSPTTQLIGSSLPVQSCQSGSNLTVVVNSANNQVIAYAPNGSWGEVATGIMAVELEGPFGSLPTMRTLIPTPDAINTCAGDSTSGRVVCTGNNNNIYLIQGTAIVGTMSSSAATGYAYFSGGACTTCNVAVDPIHHDAWISMALAGGAVGVQRLDITAAWNNLPSPPQSVLSAAITTESSPYETLSEAISVDPGVVGGRRLVLSPNEENNYQLIDASPAGAGTVYNNNLVIPSGGLLDHAAQDCSTGIILSAIEFSQEIYLADLNQATFSGTGPAATWSTPAQSITPIPELNNYGWGVAGGIAVSSNNALHLGIMANEFGGNGFIAFQLPSSAGSGTPQLVDYVAAGLPDTPAPSTWQMGWDPHTIGVYTSPNTGRQYAIFQNDPLQDGSGTRDYLAIVDIEKLLTVAPRTGAHTVDPLYDLVANGILTFIQNTP